MEISIVIKLSICCSTSCNSESKTVPLKFLFWILKGYLWELRWTLIPNAIKTPVCLTPHSWQSFFRCNVTRPWIWINFCPKSRSSSFSFSCLQQSTHHHPSCYLHQFLLIKLQTSFIIIFISFCIGLAEKLKKNSKLVFWPHIQYIKFKSSHLLGEGAGYLCPLKKIHQKH